jgi:MFS family permease
VARFGSRLVSPVSVVAYALALYGLSQSPTVHTFSLALFIFGFVGDTVNIAMNTQGLDVQRAMDKPILSSFHALWSVGALCGALVGGWTLKQNLDTATHMLIIFIPVSILALVNYRFLLPDEGKGQEGGKLFALPDKALLLIGIICLCATLCEGAMADWSALYYQEVLSGPVGVITAGFTGYAFTMALGRFSGDRLIHAFGYRNVLMLDAVLIAGGMALALAFRWPAMVILGFGLVGFGVSTIIPIAYSMAGRSNTLRPSVALAAVSTVGFTGFLIGPPVIGFIAHEVGLRTALLLVTALGVVIFLLSSTVGKRIN